MMGKMEKDMKSRKNPVRILVLSLALCWAACAGAQSTNIVLGPITNDSVYVTQELDEYWIQAGSGGNGTVSGQTNDWIVAGSNFTVLAAADAHYHFVSWSNGSTENPLTAAATSPTNLSASFSIDTYGVAIHAGVFDVSPTNFVAVPYGQSVTTAVQSIYVTNAPGVRMKFTGYQKIQ